MESVAAALADRYRLLRELGSGGMAIVHLAEDRKHQRLVAMKVLRPELAAVLSRERFQREIQVAARLQHPNIVPVFDSGEDAGQLWYAMPYVEGESLRDRLQRDAQLPLADALQIVREVASALTHAHQQGIVHRDIKPENILLSGGHAVVADFGIARALDEAGGEKLTQTGLALGTPFYMSPEQAEGGGRIDGRSDVYALAAVLYEMLAGVPPFTGPTAQSVLARHAVDPVPSLRTVRTSVPVTVEAAITRALAKVPADRFESAGEFSAALTKALPSPALHDPAASRWRQRTVAAALLVIVAVAAWALFSRRSGGRSVNANLIAVAPFRVSAADPALGYLRDGMIDLLGATFNGEASPRAVESRSVAGAWSKASTAGVEPDEKESLRLAQKLGAGGLVLGSIVGDGRRLSLRASLLDVPNGHMRGQAVAEGEQDSLQSLVDRLAAQLLGLKAGVARPRLASLTSTSLPAVLAYLKGQAAFRKGRFEEAQLAYREALEIDSTFALAALALGSSVSTDGDRRGVHLAWAYRARLSPADRALAEARAGPAYPAPSTRVESVAAWEVAAAANPDRAEVWYGLGDLYFHNGRGIGMADALVRADSAFRRGQALDSLAENNDFPDAPEAIGHMMELAARNRDSARARQLLASARAADSARNQPMMRWLMAQAARDTVTLDSLRRHPELFTGSDFIQLFTFSQWNGIGIADLESVLRYWWARDSRFRGRLRLMLFNGGRPAEAIALDSSTSVSAQAAQRIYEGLFWDGDTATARHAATILGPVVAGPIGVGSNRLAMVSALSYLEQWRLSQGQTGTAREAIARLRGDLSAGASPFVRGEAEYFADVLEAWLNVETRQSNVLRSLNRLDSIARGRWPDHINLTIARLYEKAGDPKSALRAVRRGGGGFGLNMALLSTFLREEGRLSTLSGDTAGATRAYEHYLALRWNPEPALKPEVDETRRELARLMGERRR